jgi:dolichyl-phosphate-mannose--protein O-mannosyl transferase
MTVTTTLRFLSFLVLLSSIITLAAGNDDTEDAITCGSAIKLTHVESSSASTTNESFLLNSESKNLGSGSGQQIVTAVAGQPTSLNALWWIRGPNDTEQRAGGAACKEGTATPIKCNDIIRLTHLQTQVNLHSHNVSSHY